MSLLENTKVFTDSGWKNIQDVSGHDRLLVRNFLGNAEFVQPYAIKKKQYDGNIISLLNKYFSMSFTPNHIITYISNNKEYSSSVEEASKLYKIRFYRKFGYSSSDTRYESLNRKKSNRREKIKQEDWHVIILYTILRGYISKDKSPMLKYVLYRDDQVNILTNILKKYGITWGITYNHFGAKVVTVNRDTGLATKLKTYLGGRARRDMKIPISMVFKSNKTLSLLMINTLKTLVGRSNKNVHTFKTVHKNLVDSLELIGIFGGFTVRHFHTVGVMDSYIVTIAPVAKLCSPSSLKESNYSGYVYEFDLFDGLIFVKKEGDPIWVNPK